MNKFKVDVIVGLQSGDEGKGKITHHLLKSGKYTHCVGITVVEMQATPSITTVRSL